MCLDIELTCFTYEGIDGVIAALKAGEQVSNDDIQIKVGNTRAAGRATQRRRPGGRS